MGIFIKVGAIALIAFSIAVYARTHDGTPSSSGASQAASVALAPQPVRVALEGTIVFDDTLASDREPFLLYTEDSRIKTKRLILPAAYACQAGDLPCSSATGSGYPFSEGDAVLVEGIAEADLIRVERITIRSRSAILEPI